jgi:GNAT superfamily N-acetyltransferase
MNLHIRGATITDMDLVYTLILQKTAFDGALPLLKATPETLKQTLFGASPLATVILAEVNETPVGFALVYYTYSSLLAQSSLWMDDLFIQPHMRGRGIGTALVTYLAELAQSRNCGRMDWMVATDNTQGMAFYQKLGATILERNRVCRFDQDTLTTIAKQQLTRNWH